MNKKLLLSLGSIAAIAASVATVVACGSSDTNKDLKDINGITVNDVNQKIDEELTEYGFNKPDILPSVVPNPGDDIVINGVHVAFTEWTPNDSEGSIAWKVTFTKGSETGTLSGTNSGFKKE